MSWLICLRSHITSGTKTGSVSIELHGPAELFEADRQLLDDERGCGDQLCERSHVLAWPDEFKQEMARVDADFARARRYLSALRADDHAACNAIMIEIVASQRGSQTLMALAQQALDFGRVLEANRLLTDERNEPISFQRWIEAQPCRSSTWRPTICASWTENRPRQTSAVKPSAGRGAGGPITFSDDRTQARPKRHPNAALMHRGGPGVSARFAHRKLPFICAQNNGIPLGSCADSFIASHGSATSRRPTRDPAGSQAPVVAHTNVLESESRPKSYTG